MCLFFILPDLGSYRPGGEGDVALPGYNDNEIQEILSGFGGAAQPLNTYSPPGGRRTGRRQRLNFSNKRNQREIQPGDSTEQTNQVELEEK